MHPTHFILSSSFALILTNQSIRLSVYLTQPVPESCKVVVAVATVCDQWGPINAMFLLDWITSFPSPRRLRPALPLFSSSLPLPSSPLSIGPGFLSVPSFNLRPNPIAQVCSLARPLSQAEATSPAGVGCGSLFHPVNKRTSGSRNGVGRKYACLHVLCIRTFLQLKLACAKPVLTFSELILPAYRGGLSCSCCPIDVVSLVALRVSGDATRGLISWPTTPTPNNPRNKKSQALTFLIRVVCRLFHSNDLLDPASNDARS